MKIKDLLLLIIIFSICPITKAQQTISAAGGDANGTGGTVSYTVGQVAYTTNTGTNGSVSQGIQQVYEISVVSDIDEYTDIKLSVATYPNPVEDKLILKIEAENATEYDYQIFDMNGSLIEANKIVSNESIIFMGNLSPAIYFLIVTEGQKEIKTFKIIKK
jgi:hypothetical protein